MNFAFSWEFPAAVIGAIAVSIATLAIVVAIARTHHGPTHAELALLGILAVMSVWTWNTRLVLAQRFFPDTTGVVEESVAHHLLNHSDCAAFVAHTGMGRNDGAVCTVRVLSARGRYVAASAPRKSFESPCDVTPNEEVRLWSFGVGSLRDWCSR
jgi:hypothetical protein